MFTVAPNTIFNWSVGLNLLAIFNMSFAIVLNNHSRLSDAVTLLASMYSVTLFLRLKRSIMHEIFNLPEDIKTKYRSKINNGYNYALCVMLLSILGAVGVYFSTRTTNHTPLFGATLLTLILQLAFNAGCIKMLQGILLENQKEV